MSGVGGSLAALRAATRNRDLRRLQLADAGSATGQWAAQTAVSVYLYQAGGAGAVALGFVLRMVPAGLAGPFAGALADRLPRRRVMMAADLSRAVVFAALAGLVLAGAPLGAVLAVTSLSGIAGAPFGPARAALVPSLAREPEELTAANVLSSTIESASILVGPALAGVILAVSSVEVALAFTAACLLWSALLVSAIREPARAPADVPAARPGLVREAADGLHAAAARPGVPLLIGLFAAQVLVDGALKVLAVAVAIDLLDIGESGLGWLNAASGAGGLLGAALAVGLVGRTRLAGPFAIGMLGWGVPLLLMGVLPEFAVALLALGVLGVANTLIDVSGITLLQRITPDELLGRVFGMLDSLVLLCVAAGTVITAPLVSLLGVRTALVVVGAFLPAVIVLSWAALRRLDASAAPVPAARLELLRGLAIFAPLSPVTLEGLARALTEVEVAAGADAVAQGEVGDRYYVIAAGEADVLVDGQVVRRLDRGDAFGEIALLRDEPRTATVRARTPLKLLALERRTFLSAVTGHGPSREAAEAVAGARLAFASPSASFARTAEEAPRA